MKIISDMNKVKYIVWKHNLKERLKLKLDIRRKYWTIIAKFQFNKYWFQNKDRRARIIKPFFLNLKIMQTKQKINYL